MGDFLVRWTDHRSRFGKMEPGLRVGRFAKPDISGQYHDGDPAACDCRLHGYLQNPRHLLRLGDQFAIMAAFAEKAFRAGLLKIIAADLLAWNVGRNGHDRDAAAMAVVQSIDQMQVARPATSRANRKMSGQMGFRSRRERGGFLVSHRNPFDLVPLADRVGDSVEGISGQAVDVLHARRHQSVDEHIRYSFFGHRFHKLLLVWAISCTVVFMVGSAVSLNVFDSGYWPGWSPVRATARLPAGPR